MGNRFQAKAQGFEGCKLFKEFSLKVLNLFHAELSFPFLRENVMQENKHFLLAPKFNLFVVVLIDNQRLHPYILTSLGMILTS